MGQLLALSDRRLARLANGAPRTPWDRFYSRVFDWQHGEHVGLIGPTGQGKTTLLRAILPKHPYIVICATKPRDKSMDAFVKSGYVVMDRWRSIDPRQMPKRILWPDASHIDSAKTQTEVFREAFAKIYREGAWTVSIDELYFMANELGLKREIKVLLTQSRALDISLVNASQRPAFIPTEVYDQSTHLFFWRNNDRRAQQRLGEINSVDSDLVRDVVANLERFQVLYINTRTGAMVRTRCPSPNEGR